MTIRLSPKRPAYAQVCATRCQLNRAPLFRLARRGRAMPLGAVMWMVILAILLLGSIAGTARAGNTAYPLADFACSDVTQIPLAECEALVALHTATDGSNWLDNSGWLTTNTPCSWHGVTCVGGHVTRLNLTGNQLNGFLPAELADLADLKGLFLGSNQLAGTLPPWLGTLVDLQALDLSSNQFAGAMDPSLGDLTGLQTLLLFNNQLDGAIPPQLGNLSNLRTLQASDNLLSGSIPAELGNLGNLRNLILSNNQLSAAPGGWAVPPQLGNLSSLEGLGLSDNPLGGSIPPELGNLDALQSLGMNNNQLSGSIPSALSSVSGLLTLDLGDNQLDGTIPPELGSLSSLRELWLYSNQLTGNLPPELGSLSNLRILVVDDNPLSGTLSMALISLTLDQFWFDDTSLCEPDDEAFQLWVNGIENLQSTGLICTLTWPDLNGDGAVNVGDLVLIADCWSLPIGGACPDFYDHEPDGDLDIADVMAVAGAWMGQRDGRRSEGRDRTSHAGLSTTQGHSARDPSHAALRTID